MWIMFWVAVLAGQIMLAVEGGGPWGQPDVAELAAVGAVSFFGW
ncbi:hypothetical protein [Aquicoccus porphyridii]|nr:hypothetical protein [Aquicoccus porphyridii]